MRDEGFRKWIQCDCKQYISIMLHQKTLPNSFSSSCASVAICSATLKSWGTGVFHHHHESSWIMTHHHWCAMETMLKIKEKYDTRKEVSAAMETVEHFVWWSFSSFLYSRSCMHFIPVFLNLSQRVMTQKDAKGPGSACPDVAWSSQSALLWQMPWPATGPATAPWSHSSEIQLWNLEV